MELSEVRRAVEAATATASALGLRVDDAVVVHNSDRIAVRLIPCDVLARVAPTNWRMSLEFEAEVARRLAATDSPVGELEPRVESGVYLRDGFSITLWTYYEPVDTDRRDGGTYEQVGLSTDLAADYAHALLRLHAGLRTIDLDAPHISARLAGWAAGAGDRHSTPELPEPDRELVSNTLKRVTAAISSQDSDEQLLHGEPHPENLLNTRRGPLFIDLGTCQRGPIEYDLAYVPKEVADHYPGANQDLVHQFRILMWAGVATMRWNRNDQFPNRDYWRTESLNQLRTALG